MNFKVLMLIVLLVFSSIGGSFLLQKTDILAYNEFSNIAIVLDAGHGGIDNGMTGKITGVTESEINLAIVKVLEKQLKSAGFKTILTRNSALGLYGMPTKGFTHRDLQARVDITNNSNANLFISIHCNSFSNTSINGIHSFSKIDSTESDRLSTIIQSNLNNMGYHQKQYKSAYGDYYVLNNSNITAVLIECGFLSNPYDENLLTNSSYHNDLAKQITESVITYFLTI